jgi:hypothetical protein
MRRPRRSNSSGLMFEDARAAHVFVMDLCCVPAG